jgi:hypothetical protein
MGNRSAVLLSSLEVQTDILRLPRLPRKQREKTIRRELRSRYPGNADNVDVECFPLPRSRKEREEKVRPLAVFTAEPETGLRYREKRGPVIPGLAFLLAGKTSAGKESDLILLVTPEWIDAASFAGEELADYSTIGRKSVSPPFDLLESLRAKTETEKRGPVLIILKDTDETDDYVQSLKQRYADHLIIGIGDLYGKINMRKCAVFRRRKTVNTFPDKNAENTKKAATFLMAVYGLSLFLALAIVTAKAENNAAALKRTYDERKALHDEGETLLAEISALENSVSGSGQNDAGFPDPYTLTAEIYRRVRGAQIHSIIIQGEKFSFEAEARDALRLIRELEQSPYFTGITLHQTMPSSADREQFSVSGRIRHE